MSTMCCNMNQVSIKEKELTRMTEEREVSKQRKEFLENLRLYLFSSGKRSRDIEEIVEELEVHSYEAEQKGKPMEKIIGTSAKEEIVTVTDEMSLDSPSWIEPILLIVLCSFSFTILPDVWNGKLAYSVLEISGHISIAAIFIASIFIGFKHTSKTNPSVKKQIFILVPVMIIPMFLFLGLIYLNEAVDTPIIYFGNTSSIIMWMVTVLFLIGFSIWAETWLFLFVLSLIIVPEHGLRLTTLAYETQLIISALIPVPGMAIYLWLSYRLKRNE